MSGRAIRLDDLFVSKDDIYILYVETAQNIPWVFGQLSSAW